MEIQKVPMNISVISREFLDDTNARSLTDLFRYSAAASGDTRFKMRVPANEATPQGGFTMRGFQVNTLMRNGVFRYISHNLDNVERVEVVKGPASVFFGQGYPGGVINYVTKRPSFTKIPTELTYQLNDNSGHKVKIDNNTVLSKKAAFRFVGAWQDTAGRAPLRVPQELQSHAALADLEAPRQRQADDQPRVRVPEGTLQRERLRLDLQRLRGLEERRHHGCLRLLDRHARQHDHGQRRQRSRGQRGPGHDDPDPRLRDLHQQQAYADRRLDLPAYTSVERGAYYTNAAGTFIQDEAFNYTARGAYQRQRGRGLHRHGGHVPVRMARCPLHLHQ
jgi:outer membrane receptor protein involved in Fe transport